MAAPEVLIVGAGIAGASAAYFAKQAGAHVTLVDAGTTSASHVPSALVNPVRGTEGKVVDGGFAAARFTFALVESLVQRGHDISFGRGLYRPVPDEATREQWQAQLPAGEVAHWHPLEDKFALKGTWAAALYLPEAGWIDTASFLKALIHESRAEIVNAEVREVDALTNAVTLEDGAALKRERLLWCGGARGAALTGPELHTFRPGSVLVLDKALCDVALSYGIYTAPCRHRAGQGVVGSTSEPRASSYNVLDNAWALERLEARVRRTWRSEPQVTASFRGVRFSRNAPAKFATLDGFGSRGYLLAPQAACDWAARTFGPAAR